MMARRQEILTGIAERLHTLESMVKTLVTATNPGVTAYSTESPSSPRDPSDSSRNELPMVETEEPD